MSSDGAEKVRTAPTTASPSVSGEPGGAAPDAQPPPTVLTAAAWRCVLGATCCLFSTFGFLNAIGVFQDFYEREILQTSTPNAIAWIGSLSFGILFAGGAVGGLLMDRLGPRPLMVYQAIFFPLSCMLTSLCKEYYQVLLAQGLLQGLSLSCSFSVPVACCMIWFKEKKGIAVGIVISASSLGGVLWPIIVKALLDNAGFGWTWRAIGFITLGLLVICALTVTSPLEHHQSSIKFFKRRATDIEKANPAGPPRLPFIYMEALHHVPYLLFAISYFFTFLGISYLIFFLPSWGRTKGLSTSLQTYCVSVFNAASFFGRLLIPITASRLGAFNLFVLCSSGCMIVIFASMAVTNPAGVLVIAVIYGFTSGGVVSLLASCTASVTPDMRRISSALGQLSVAAAAALVLGAPICGWIIDSPTGFTGAQGFAGGAVAVGVILTLVARFVICKKLIAAV